MRKLIMIFLLITSMLSLSEIYGDSKNDNGEMKADPTKMIVGIESDPQDANVYVNSSRVGTTPISMNLEIGKSYRVIITKERYKPISDVLHIQSEGEAVKRFYRLEKIPAGTLKWKFETGAEVDSSPAISEDGTVYIGSEIFYAIYDGVVGTPWPMFRHDPRHTGRYGYEGWKWPCPAAGFSLN